jgi:Rps23 Pro-64 3,4-dihydroxylase Tpa1-like proline 4-hydroxylase
MKVIDIHESCLIIDDFFNDKEVESIWKELDFLTSSQTLINSENSAPARDSSGRSLKNNYVNFLDLTYTERKTSSIINNFDKIYNDEVKEIIEDKNREFRYYFSSNTDRTFISYYENKGYYKPHSDRSILTFLYWCNKQPKSFTGGDFSIPELGLDIEYKNNRLVVIPSHLLHSVSPIEMNNNDTLSGNGRYCITRFLYIFPIPQL